MKTLLNRPFATLTLLSLAGALFIGAGGCSDDALEDTKDIKDKEEPAPDAGGASEPRDSGTVCGEEEPTEDLPEVTFSGDGAECGDNSCQGASVEGFENFAVEGCCADEGEGQCGLDLSFLGSLLGLADPGCEPLDLPGSCDPVCAPSEPIQSLLMLEDELVFPGCCQENGRCGYLASIAGLGFGCVSPTRFSYDEGVKCSYSAEE